MSPNEAGNLKTDPENQSNQTTNMISMSTDYCESIGNMNTVQDVHEKPFYGIHSKPPPEFPIVKSEYPIQNIKLESSVENLNEKSQDETPNTDKPDTETKNTTLKTHVEDLIGKLRYVIRPNPPDPLTPLPAETRSNSFGIAPMLLALSRYTRMQDSPVDDLVETHRAPRVSKSFRMEKITKWRSSRDKIIESEDTSDDSCSSECERDGIDEVEEDPPDPNYSRKKSIVQGMMDLALLTANSNQLRTLLEYEKDIRTFKVALWCILASLFIQIAVGLTMIIFRRKLKHLTHSQVPLYVKRADNFVLTGVFLVTVLNVFIATFSSIGDGKD